MSDERRHRDAGSGQFVDEAYADAHPDTTTSERLEPRADPEQLRVAQNLALMLTEQLGIPVGAYVAEGLGDEPQVIVGLSIETAQMIHTEGRKLVAR